MCFPSRSVFIDKSLMQPPGLYKRNCLIGIVSGKPLPKIGNQANGRQSKMAAGQQN